MSDDEEDPVVVFVRNDTEDIGTIAARVNSLVDAFLRGLPPTDGSTLPSTESTPAALALARAQQQQSGTGTGTTVKLDDRTENELVAMLNGQDFSVIRVVCAEMGTRVSAASARREAMMAALETPVSLRALADLMFTEDQALHVLVLKVLYAIADHSGDVIRRVGVISTLGESFVRTSDAGKVVIMYILQKLAVDARNRSAIAKCGMVKQLVTLCSISNPALSSTALRTLAVMTDNCNKTQEAVVKDGGGDVCLELALPKPGSNDCSDRDPRVFSAAISLLKNLCLCASFKMRIKKESISRALQLLNVRAIYPETKFIFDTPSGKSNEADVELQCTILDILSVLALLDAHKETIGTTGIPRLIEYITPSSSMAYDVFPWNMMIEERVLGLLNTLLTDSNNRAAFVKAGGLEKLVSIVSLPEQFSEAAEVTCSSIITGPLAEEMKKLQGMETILIRLFKFLPGNPGLQHIIVNTFSEMAKDERGSQKIFEEGGVHILTRLLSTENSGMKIAILSTLSQLSSQKFIRRAMRLLDPEFQQIGTAAKSLVSDERSFQPIVELVTNMALSDGGAEYLTGDALKNVLVLLGSLCVCPNSEVRHKVVDTFARIVMGSHKETGLPVAAASGALEPVLRGMAYPDLGVQLDCMALATGLCTVPGSRDSLERVDFVSSLKAIGKTTNVLKKTPQILDALSALIAAWKRATSASSQKGFEIVLDGGEGLTAQFPVSPDTVEVLLLEERATVLLGASKRDVFVFAKADAKDPHAGVVIKSTDDLRRVLKADIAAGLLSSVIRVRVKQRSSVMFSKAPLAASPRSTDRHTEPRQQQPQQKPATSVELDAIGVEELKRLVTILCERAHISVTEAVALLRAPPPPKPSAPSHRDIVRATTPPSPRFAQIDQGDVMGNVMAELRHVAISGTANMRHVDLTKERERRLREAKDSAKQGLLHDIAQRSVEKPISRRLISQEVLAGKELWRRGLGQWIKEVTDCLLGGAAPGALLRLVVSLCLSSQSQCSWSDAIGQLMHPVAPTIVARQLIRIGFGVSQCSFMADGEDSVTMEYRAVHRPYQLPVKQLLRIIEFKVAEAL